MVIPSIPPRIKFRPISANFGRNSFSGRYEFCLLIFPFWTWSASFLLDHQKSFSFSHLYLIFTLVAPCLSIISHHLTLSTVWQRSWKENWRARWSKKSVTCETKREKKKTRRGENISEGEMMKKECNNESSSIWAANVVVTSHEGGLGNGRNWKNSQGSFLEAHLCTITQNMSFILFF